MRNVIVLLFLLLALNCFGAGATISSFNGQGTNTALTYPQFIGTAANPVLLPDNGIMFVSSGQLFIDADSALNLWGVPVNLGGQSLINAKIGGSSITNTVGSATNTFYASSYEMILHTNNSVTVYASGINSASTNISFPASTTAGFNEIFSLLNFRTNSPFNGVSIQIDAGLYPFTTQLVISNSCTVTCARNGGTIFRYVGATNGFTMNKLTNAITHNDPTLFLDVALLAIKTNPVIIPNTIEGILVPQVTIDGLTIQTSTNMYCVGIYASCGDHAKLENVNVGGSELIVKPPYYNMFSGDLQATPPKMIGYVTGENQIGMNDCSAQNVQVGLIEYGNSFGIINHFQAISCGRFVGDSTYTNAFPTNSELHFGVGVLIPKVSQSETYTFNNLLTFNCYIPIWADNGNRVILNQWEDQNSKFHNFIMANPNQANVVLNTMSASPHSVLSITNDNAGGNYGIDLTEFSLTNVLSVSVIEHLTGGGGTYGLNTAESTYLNNIFEFGFEDDYGSLGAGNFTINPNLILTANGSSLSLVPASALTGDIQASQLVGTLPTLNAGALTNLSGNTLKTAATNRLVFTTVTSLTNTLGREATAIVTAGTSVALQDTNGTSIATIGTIATLDVLVPMHVNMRLAGTGVSAILY